MNKTDNKAKSNARKYVLLDTNVIQHFSNSELALEILKHLSEAASEGFKVSISEITLFELIDGASPEKEHERLNTLGKMKRFYVKRNVLITAAHLGCLYQTDGHTVKDIGDKIIGATAVLTGSLIYTFNGRDYPRPFFYEVARREARYYDNKQEKVMMAYFLQPDVNHIVEQYKLRVQPFEEKLDQKQEKVVQKTKKSE